MESLKETVVVAIEKRVLDRIKHGSEFSVAALIQFEIPKEYNSDRRERYFREVQRRLTSRSAENRRGRAEEKRLAAESAKEAQRRYP